MAKPLLPDALWERIQPLLPEPKARRHRYPGRKPVDHRKTLTGILFVLKTGIPWEDLPQEMGCGSGMTCWRRLRDWQADGTWAKIHKVLLDKLRGADKMDWSRSSADSRSLRALGGREKTGSSPIDRRKKESKHYLLVDAKSTPLAATITTADVPDVKQLEFLVDAISAVRGKRGRPRRRPKEVHADPAYDSKPHRRRLRRRGIRPWIARCKTPHGSGLGKFRWVEQTLLWLARKHKLQLRTERRAEIREALTLLSCALICFSLLKVSLC